MKKSKITFCLSRKLFSTTTTTTKILFTKLMKHSMLKILSFNPKLDEWQHDLIFWWEKQRLLRKKLHHYFTISWTLSLFSPSDIRCCFEKDTYNLSKNCFSLLNSFYFVQHILCSCKSTTYIAYLVFGSYFASLSC